MVTAVVSSNLDLGMGCSPTTAPPRRCGEQVGEVGLTLALAVTGWQLDAYNVGSGVRFLMAVRKVM